MRWRRTAPGSVTPQYTCPSGCPHRRGLGGRLQPLTASRNRCSGPPRTRGAVGAHNLRLATAHTALSMRRTCRRCVTWTPLTSIDLHHRRQSVSPAQDWPMQIRLVAPQKPRRSLRPFADCAWKRSTLHSEGSGKFAPDRPARNLPTPPKGAGAVSIDGDAEAPGEMMEY